MTAETTGPELLLARLREAFDARAAGWWQLRGGDRLEQVAFASAHDMPDDIARGFAEATRSVPLSRAELGIVRAAVSGRAAVSLIADVSTESGSGLWLRRFGATRSVAVPLRSRDGSVARVVSLALEGGPPDDQVVAAKIESIASEWPDL